MFIFSRLSVKNKKKKIYSAARTILKEQPEYKIKPPEFLEKQFLYKMGD